METEDLMKELITRIKKEVIQEIKQKLRIDVKTKYPDDYSAKDRYLLLMYEDKVIQELSLFELF